MTNKEFYGDKLLAVALEANCNKLYWMVHGKSCATLSCRDCEFGETKESEIEKILQRLNAEHVEPEPPLLENGDGLKPGDWIMVSMYGEEFVKRQFLFFHNGMFCTTVNDDVCGCFGNYMSWDYARLPKDGE